MSNTRRPTLDRKRTPRDEKARKEALDEGMSVTVDGEVYTVRMGDLTSVDTMALRRATGFSFVGLMRAAATDADIDIIAALVWLARRIDGEKLLDYDTVAREIGYDADIDVADPVDEDPEGEGPEA